MAKTDSMVPRIFRYMAKYSNVKAHGQEKIQPWQELLIAGSGKPSPIRPASPPAAKATIR